MIGPDDNIKPDNLDNCSPCKTYKELEDFCYKEWFSSEGHIPYIYADSKGFPTTGIGLLIYRPSYQDKKGWHSPNGTDEYQRNLFQSTFSFYDKTKKRHLTLEEKGALFDKIVADYKAGKLGNDYHIDLYPQYTQTENDIRNSFNIKFKQWYDSAKQKHPDLLKMPRSLAQVTMHMYWWGKGEGANNVSHKLPYDKQAENMLEVAKDGDNPNFQMLADLNAAIADCKYVVNEACITRNTDGSIEHYTDTKKTIRLSTEYPKGKDINGQKVKEVWYRQEEPNKGGIDYTIGVDNVEYNYREDGKVLDYTRDKDDLKTYYRADGKTKSYTRDKNGNELHFHEDGKSLDFSIDKDGNEVHFRADGKTKDYSKHKNGYEIHYQPDGQTKDFTKDAIGNEEHYGQDGKTLRYTKDKNGYEIHYHPDGKTRDFTKDADGNEVHYKDEQTVNYTCDKFGNEVNYGSDGKVEYTKQNGCYIHYNANGQVSSIQQDDLKVRLDNGIVVSVSGVNDGQKYDIYYQQNNVSRVENDVEGTVYYAQNGKVDYVKDNEGKTISRQIFGSNQRKRCIERAEVITADAAERVDNLQIEEQRQASSSLITKMEQIKKESVKHPVPSQDLRTSLSNQRKLAEHNLSKNAKNTRITKSPQSKSKSRTTRSIARSRSR